MKAVAYKSKGSKLELIELPIPEPKKGEVRLKVISCGICHTDMLCGVLIQSQRVPGHEVIGSIEKMGEGIDTERFKIGMVVGVGWFGGNHCTKCRSCLEDQWIHCKHQTNCGLHYDGGYAEYMTCPEDALVVIPDGMDPVETAPLLCAGVTVFNGFRNQYIKAGALVGVQGIGGLGHLGIQFCRKMGYEVIAMSYGNHKRELAMQLGANHYVDMSSKDCVEKIQKIGSVKCIICTAPSASALPGLIDCLGVNGKVVVTAAFPEDFSASSIKLIDGSKCVMGWASGDSRDSTDTIHFARLNDIKPMVKVFPLEKAAEALENIDKARFRYVISFLPESRLNSYKINERINKN
ncbi:hypothetical protein DICPUDRAFT_92718 [Dictyostelium purpureum]|uniref:Enoyl reductase (ER) domain-containing protein n=1 Tax=Dictyostelium purpureum TaxID=5786 RepID=F0ZW81_DICPU|nr:uncharacterized protein DICPUDRAFT_92718 [Dictyostelium purpureum]EGC31809.1 hypothetical protein DICPUDRAFT_92718 [Dictyostelium purpureum]|eukprot:XP_003291676.1 hypothetical protein DICPUDRAFT_92718 [Dictyostelium purpureum]